MFNKTSSIPFLKFGEVFTDMPIILTDAALNQFEIEIKSDPLNSLFQANEDIYLRCTEGFCMLVVTEDLNHPMEEFVIHRITKINQGTYFNFSAISEKAHLYLQFEKSLSMKTVFLSAPYQHRRVRRLLEVKEMMAYFYNVRGAHYTYPKTLQHAYELTYVDSGCLLMGINDETFLLHGDEMILHGPQDIVSYETRDAASSYLTVMFTAQLPQAAQKELLHTVFPSNPDIRRNLEVFAHQEPSPYLDSLLINALERLLLDLLAQSQIPARPVSSIMQEKFENETLTEITMYIQENLYSSLNVEDLCRHFALSRSTLQALFTTHLDMPPKQYISTLKLRKSRILIKENKYTISEIAGMLGYSSIHYFSRIFKNEYGMTPSEYARKLVD